MALLPRPPPRAQISPGPLSRAHAKLEGSTRCLDCHDPGKGVAAEQVPGLPQARCRSASRPARACTRGPSTGTARPATSSTRASSTSSSGGARRGRRPSTTRRPGTRSRASTRRCPASSATRPARTSGTRDRLRLVPQGRAPRAVRRPGLLLLPPRAGVEAGPRLRPREDVLAADRPPRPGLVREVPHDAPARPRRRRGHLSRLPGGGREGLRELPRGHPQGPPGDRAARAATRPRAGGAPSSTAGFDHVEDGLPAGGTPRRRELREVPPPRPPDARQARPLHGLPRRRARRPAREAGRRGPLRELPRRRTASARRASASRTTRRPPTRLPGRTSRSPATSATGPGGRGPAAGDRPCPLHFASTRCLDCHKDPHRGEDRPLRREGRVRDRATGSTSWRAGGLRPRPDDATRSSGRPRPGGVRALPPRARGAGRPAGSRFAGVPQACEGCHRDPHQGQFARAAGAVACERCHTTDNLKASKFDHTRDAALRASTAPTPALACAACHRPETRNGATLRPLQAAPHDVPRLPRREPTARERRTPMRRPILAVGVAVLRAGAGPAPPGPEHERAAPRRPRTSTARSATTPSSGCRWTSRRRSGTTRRASRSSPPTRKVSCRSCHRTPRLQPGGDGVRRLPPGRAPRRAGLPVRVVPHPDHVDEPARDVPGPQTGPASRCSPSHARLDCTACHREPGALPVQEHSRGVRQLPPLDLPRGPRTPATSRPGFSRRCEDCHLVTSPDVARARRFSHPASFPLAGGHAAPRLRPLPRRRQRTPACRRACVSCHQQDYAATTNPNHAAGRLPDHLRELPHDRQPGARRTSTTTRPVSRSTGAHARVDCSRCHVGGRYAGTPTDCYCLPPGRTTPGTTNPNHQASGFPTQCQSCHNTGAWRPANFDHNADAVPADRRPHPGGLRAVPRGRALHGDAHGLLRLPPGRATRAPRNPNHQAAGFPIQCQSCHTTAAWRPASFDHDGRYFPIYSGTHRGEWSSCCECHVNSGQLQGLRVHPLPRSTRTRRRWTATTSDESGLRLRRAPPATGATATGARTTPAASAACREEDAMGTPWTRGPARWLSPCGLLASAEAEQRFTVTSRSLATIYVDGGRVQGLSPGTGSAGRRARRPSPSWRSSRRPSARPPAGPCRSSGRSSRGDVVVHAVRASVSSGPSPERAKVFASMAPNVAATRAAHDAADTGIRPPAPRTCAEAHAHADTRTGTHACDRTPAARTRATPPRSSATVTASRSSTARPPTSTSTLAARRASSVGDRLRVASRPGRRSRSWRSSTPPSTRRRARSSRETRAGPRGRRGRPRGPRPDGPRTAGESGRARRPAPPAAVPRRASPRRPPRRSPRAPGPASAVGASFGYYRSWDETESTSTSRSARRGSTSALYDIAGQPLELHAARTQPAGHPGAARSADRTPTSERTDRLYEVALRYEPPSDSVRLRGRPHRDLPLRRHRLPRRRPRPLPAAAGGAGRGLRRAHRRHRDAGLRRHRQKYGGFVRLAPGGRYAMGGYDVDPRLRARERGRRREPRVPEPREPLRKRQPLVALPARGARPQHRLAPGGHRQELPALERLALREPAGRPVGVGLRLLRRPPELPLLPEPRRPGGGVRRPAPPGPAGGRERLAAGRLRARRPASA